MTISLSPGIARRNTLESVTNTYATQGSVYIPAVHCINQTLKSCNVGLSSRSLASITDNIKKVYKGNRTEAAASLRECAAFTRDTFYALAVGHFVDALASASGVIMNGVGSTLYFANYDRERLSPHAKALYDMMHP